MSSDEAGTWVHVPLSRVAQTRLCCNREHGHGHGQVHRSACRLVCAPTCTAAQVRLLPTTPVNRARDQEHHGARLKEEGCGGLAQQLSHDVASVQASKDSGKSKLRTGQLTRHFVIYARNSRSVHAPLQRVMVRYWRKEKETVVCRRETRQSFGQTPRLSPPTRLGAHDVARLSSSQTHLTGIAMTQRPINVETCLRCTQLTDAAPSRMLDHQATRVRRMRKMQSPSWVSTGSHLRDEPRIHCTLQSMHQHESPCQAPARP